MNIRIKRMFLLLLLSLSLCSTFVYSTYADYEGHEEGEIYLDDDGFYYQIVDGRPFKLVGGEYDDTSSITDQMTSYTETNTPDAEVMNKSIPKIQKVCGTAISFIIMIFFAMTVFTTMCDLLYIGLPFLRPILYNQQGQSGVGTANANLVGRNEAWTQLAQNSMGRANQHNMNAQNYQQQAQNLAMMGDIRGAQRAMGRANSEAHMAQNNANWANRHMQSQAQSDAWRAQHNQRAMQSAQQRAQNNAERNSQS